MEINKNFIVEKYKNKILARPNFQSDYLLTTKDFMNMDAVISFFYDYFEHEVDLTVDGYLFLSEYYGIDHIAKTIFEEKNIGCNMDVSKIVWYVKNRVCELYKVAF